MILTPSRKNLRHLVVVSALSIFGLSGCIKLEAPILPNVNLKAAMPPATDPAAVPQGSNATPQSAQDGTTGTKTVIAPIGVTANVAQSDGFGTDTNCFELVRLSNQAVVVDAGSQACPDNGTSPLPTAALQFTAVYRTSSADPNTYILSYNSTDIGEMTVSPDGSTLTLTQLCTGKYNYYCTQPVAGGLLAGPPNPL